MKFLTISKIILRLQKLIFNEIPVMFRGYLFVLVLLICLHVCIRIFEDYRNSIFNEIPMMSCGYSTACEQICNNLFANLQQQHFSTLGPQCNITPEFNIILNNSVIKLVSSIQSNNSNKVSIMRQKSRVPLIGMSYSAIQTIHFCGAYPVQTAKRLPCFYDC